MSDMVKYAAEAVAPVVKLTLIDTNETKKRKASKYE
jgi:hypothetical protein